ncbi:MAG: cysteine rich repeat-containing protein [Methylobacteriaceae bacterium]|jgi:hypothetical protein|uniref:3',5'-cyclic-nucleotide phosphodiesterase n=5 Tax=Methylorubrum extorquens TaxID=408 RepID=C5AX16_METEA|nr:MULTISPECIES: cysteine rich repeat-containing protein [Methylorubrum]KQO89700.1 3',5'-cyclic-nucleotide phosphodiesterase [Methylobacterium sp. Leaf92]KQO91388.1 3',5'-cyclic-nucleotide phosphodiesterase [Methylobacterium sp. Leaf90]KQP88809.1 3',5'-cyclic-nucleotide phosphodiesterase [Methylobacterium sp. Leaf119]KQQ11543.1 3',5'-cyclic-nucleotide phosphodiesterase [Methylobacterium sp. Leaf121]MDF9861493.1 hypothetical protein [Methylorubrum pseudosasae]MDH6635119.1 hypothetical protein 
MPRLATLGLLLAAPFVVASASAAPESKRGNPDLKKYCTGDALQFCGGIDSDSPEMDACFKKHRAELSENCRRAITAYEASGGK